MDTLDVLETTTEPRTGPSQADMDAVAYFGEDREFLILPLAMNEEGWMCEVNQPERLRWDGGSAVALGEKVLTSLHVSAVSAAPPLQTQAALLATGARSRLAFAKTRQLVFVESPAGEDSIRVQYWRRTASCVFVGPPAERPTWSVVLRSDATPAEVGQAVIEVLQAGGVIVGGQAASQGGATTDDVAAEDDTIGYGLFRNGLWSDYRVLVDQVDTPIDAVTTLLEEVEGTICDDPRLFVCALTTCALICLNQGFLPDYLDEPVRRLGDISNQLASEELSIYQTDVAALRNHLAANPTIVESEYPPEYFPEAWSPGSDSAWWEDLLKGVSQPV